MCFQARIISTNILKRKVQIRDGIMRNRIFRILALPVLSVFMLCGCMSLTLDFTSQLEYSYLSDCLWVVTDVTDYSDILPPNFSDEETALYFDKAHEQLFVLHKNGSDMSGRDMYYALAKYSYRMDTDTGIVSVTGDTADCYFCIDRLNDRVLTMSYYGNRDVYVAYSRVEISSVSIY